MKESEYIIWKAETRMQIKSEHPDWTKEQVHEFLEKVEANLRKKGFFDIAEEHERIKLGQTVMTRGIAIKTGKSWTFKRFVEDSLNRFENEDFGDIPDYDKRENEKAILLGGSILGAYGNGEGRIWIMREPYGKDSDAKDTFVTTVLFPDEY